MGFAYFAVAVWCDRQERRGTATPMYAVALAALAAGVAFVAGDIEALGIGLVLAVLGGTVLAVGAGVGRRATAGLGGVALVLGLTIMVVDSFDSPSAAGTALIALGVLLAATAHVVAQAINEPGSLADSGDEAPEHLTWADVGAPNATGPLGQPVEPSSPEGAPAGERPVTGPPIGDPLGPQPGTSGDEPPGEGWWRASDDRWYPPEQQSGPAG
jgi:hypothetical protein